MEINIRGRRKIVEVWLSRSESGVPKLREPLVPLCRSYSSKKYTVAVFCSGGEDLYANTRDLLLSSRRRQAHFEALQDDTRQK